MSMLELTDPVVSQYFTDGGNGTWKCKATGAVLQGENLKFYRANNGLALFGLPLANEDYSVRSGTSDTSAYVKCERAGLMYDPDRRHDNPPVAGPVYTIHVERDPRVVLDPGDDRRVDEQDVRHRQERGQAGDELDPDGGPTFRDVEEPIQ